MRGVATTWSYLAPIAYGALAYFLFRNTQNERFVSGLTTIDARTGTGRVDLNGTIGSSSIDDFNSSTHAVVATIVDGSSAPGAARDVRAILGSDGFLTLTIDPAAATDATGTVTVAWMVDTQSTSVAAAVA